MNKDNCKFHESVRVYDGNIIWAVKAPEMDVANTAAGASPHLLSIVLINYDQMNRYKRLQ